MEHSLDAGFFFALWLVSHGKWIGFGDVKLGGVLGFLFGFPGGLFVVYLGIIIGGLIGVILLASRRAGLRSAVPLGSFLALAAIAYIIFQTTFLAILARYWMVYMSVAMRRCSTQIGQTIAG